MSSTCSQATVRRVYCDNCRNIVERHPIFTLNSYKERNHMMINGPGCLIGLKTGIVTTHGYDKVSKTSTIYADACKLKNEHNTCEDYEYNGRRSWVVAMLVIIVIFIAILAGSLL